MSFHIIHACAPVLGRLIVSPHPSLYFFLQFLFQLYLMSIPAPDEISIEDPLCDSSLGSMVTLDYVTPLTEAPGAKDQMSTRWEGGAFPDLLWQSGLRQGRGDCE